MTEQQPLDDFDLDAFFDSVDKNGIANTLAVTRPEPSAPAENNLKLQTPLCKFQANILMDFFGGKTIQGIRVAAAAFKQNFEAAKQIILAHSKEESEREFYRQTTLQTLTEVAWLKFDQAIKCSGRSLPGSADEQQYRKASDAWNMIGQIVEAAADID